MLKALHHGTRPLALAALFSVAAWLASSAAASAQVAALVSPGPLAKAHSKLEGLANCQKCHEPGRKIAPARCLSCHKPIADRIAAKKGVHRDAATGCEGCHAEHAGVDAELRPFDPKNFNHAAETGFPLDGRHAPLARACARCHKSRSFLEARADCASCHQDVHKGSLGTACAACHTTAVPFAEARKAVRSREGEIPADGSPPHGRMREVPREPRLHGAEVQHVHRLPPRAAPPDFRHRLHRLPHHRDLAHEEGAARPHCLPVDRRARVRALRVVPRQTRDAGASALGEVQRLPCRRAPGQFQAGLRRVPRDRVVQESAVRPRGGRSLPADRPPRRPRLLPLSQGGSDRRALADAEGERARVGRVHGPVRYLCRLP